MTLDSRQKIDIIYQDVMRDITELLNKIDALKVEIPASINQSVDETITRSNDNFQHLAGMLHEIMPEIEKAISTQTTKAQVQVGTLVEAANALNRATGDLSTKKLASVTTAIDNVIKKEVEGAVKTSFDNAVEKSIADINETLDEVQKRVAKIAVEADHAAQGSLYTRLATIFASGIVSALISVCLLVVAIKSEFIKIDPQVSLDTRNVAERVYENFKPVSKK